MKIFFFIALLINIVFFLWEFRQGGLNSSREMAVVDSHQIKQILLVSELTGEDEGNNLEIVENNSALNDPVVSLEPNSETNSKKEVETGKHDADIVEASEQVDSVPVIPVLEETPLTVEGQEDVVINSLLNSDEPNVEQADSNNDYCYHVGPFVNHDALNIWRKLNKIDKDSVSRFNKKTDVLSSYLVYFPAEKTFAQSRKNVQRLRQKGIKDYYLFRKGELKGAISFGLFARKSRALAMQEKLVKKGFTVEIKERYKKEQLLYAEISTKDKAFKETIKISDKQAVSECENKTH